MIEFDRDLITPLAISAEGQGDLTIIHKDVLQVDFGKLAGDERIRLVGNLPYNISTPILFHALEHADGNRATCTSCCRRKWWTAWRPAPAARCTAA